MGNPSAPGLVHAPAGVLLSSRSSRLDAESIATQVGTPLEYVRVQEHQAHLKRRLSLSGINLRESCCLLLMQLLAQGVSLFFLRLHGDKL